MRLPASLVVLALALPAAAQQHVAPTPPKAPADEQKSFKVPAGFEVQLVAAEPDIQKPMQIAFDARGRLWVTTSHAYPFPAEKPHDKLFVLADFGPDGKAKTVTTFYDALNIPIGILPLPDCKSAIVSEVGKIVKLTDTDGDGKADRKEDLFTGFGAKDTHGMTNSFTHMPDGWVYACHGFANESRVRGKDGHEVRMQSGHTFRFRPDGSRIEVFTRGQVNPFGMTCDPWFNLYTADCHSKPITQLIRGAVYDSFGKPHDGLGYGPHVTRHDHGSTALCGLAWYDADHFPAEYKGTMFLGNVVTNRVNFDRIEWKGSTPVAVEQPDFLVSSDPWFRPTDLKLGPDGALYVADFYNRIIGHYEVDLKHPGRDKDRGRVWRVVYTGEKASGGRESAVVAPKMTLTDLTKLGDRELAGLLGSPNITTRLAAYHQLAARGPKVLDVVPPLLVQQTGPNAYRDVMLKVWLQFRLDPQGTNDREQVARMMDFLTPGDEPSAVVRASDLLPGTLPAGLALGSGLRSKSAHVRRAAVDTLTAHPHPEGIKPLAAFVPTIPAEDTHLRHAARIALRNALACDEAQDKLVWLLKDKLTSNEPVARVLDDVFLGVPSAYAAWWYAERFNAGTLSEQLADRAAEHVGRYGCDVHRQGARDAIRKDEKTDPKRMLGRLAALKRGAQTAGLDFHTGYFAQDDLRKWMQQNDPELLRLSIDMANLKWPQTLELLVGLASAGDRPEAARAVAFEALVKVGPEVSVPVAGGLIRDPATPARLREKAFPVFATSTKLLDLITMKDLLRDAPYREAVVIATGLAGRPEGADLLFGAVKAGQASPRLLQEKAVLARLHAAKVRDLDARVKELTAGLPSAEARLQQAITARAAGFRRAKPDPEAGKKVFAANCAACHQVGGQGGKVGPNLDGIGNRGLDRLLEDVLDPNRNIDAAFRATTLTLADGRTLTGMLVREEGAVYVLADAEGKEQRVPKADVEKKAVTALSPMPANVAEKVREDEFYQLMAYLLELRAKDVPPSK